MSLRSQAALDMRANVVAIGDSVTLTNPAGTASYSVKANVYRTDLATDPMTGEKVIEPRTVVSMAISDLPAGGITEAWRVSTTDVTGATIAGQIQAPAYDRTIGFVTFMIEAVN